MKERIDALAKACRAAMVKHRRYLHAHPEVSFGEIETARYLQEALGQLGVAVSPVVGCYSVIGRLRGDKPGKTVAFRADIDALAVQEKNDVEYRSRNDGVMHACGHDGHMAALLGLAEVFSGNRDLIAGEIVFIFQHAEEIPPGGANTLIQQGVLDGVDAVFGAHLWTPMPLGEVGWRGGALMASADKFDILVKGQGGHGSEPQNTDDVLLLGCAVVQRLQSIVSRKIDPRIPAVLSVCQFRCGSAFNVIPGECLIQGTVRTCDKAVREAVPAWIKAIAEGAVQDTNAAVEVEYGFGYPVLYNNDSLTEQSVAAINELTDLKTVEVQTAMIGEDFAYYNDAVPSAYFFIGGRNEPKGLTQPHHSAAFDFDEDALVVLVKTFLSSYLRLIG